MAWSRKPQKGGPYSSFLLVHHCSKIIICLDVTISRHENIGPNQQACLVSCMYESGSMRHDGNLSVARKTLYIAESIIVFHVIFHSLAATSKFLRINYKLAQDQRFLLLTFVLIFLELYSLKHKK